MTQKNSKCMICRGKASIQTAQPFCRACFCDMINKRIRKELKDKFFRGQKVLVIGEITHTALNQSNVLPLNLIVKEPTYFGAKNLIGLFENKKLFLFLKKSNIDAVILPWTSDHEASQFLDGLFLNDKADIKSTKLVEGVKFTKLFLRLNSNELKNYLKIINPKMKISACPKYLTPNSWSLKYLKKLETYSSGSTFTITKNREMLNAITK